MPRFTSLDCRGLGDDMVEYDSDGDMDVPRKGMEKDQELVLEHMMATDLGEVGLQVWKGSLVLADYLLEHHQQVGIWKSFKISIIILLFSSQGRVYWRWVLEQHLHLLSRLFVMQSKTNFVGFDSYIFFLKCFGHRY